MNHSIKKIFLLGVLMLSIAGIVQAQSFYLYDKSGTKTTYSIEQTRSLCFVNSSLTINLNSGEVLSIPFIDLWKMTFRSFTNVQKNETTNSVTVFPNPASDYVNISLGAAIEELDVKVSTIDGKLIYRQTYSSHLGDTYRLNISDWSRGVYIMQIFDGKKTEIKRIIKK